MNPHSTISWLCDLDAEAFYSLLGDSVRNQSWCIGMILRDGMGREVGGGFKMGNTMYTRGRFMSMYGKTNTIL